MGNIERRHGTAGKPIEPKDYEYCSSLVVSAVHDEHSRPHVLLRMEKPGSIDRVLDISSADAVRDLVAVIQKQSRAVFGSS